MSPHVVGALLIRLRDVGATTIAIHEDGSVRWVSARYPDGCTTDGGDLAMTLAAACVQQAPGPLYPPRDTRAAMCTLPGDDEKP